MDWKEAQKWELEWHLNNPFIYREQVKQEVYEEKMGILQDYADRDLKGQNIVDIGAGEQSMLLRYKNFTGIALDPLMNSFPGWVRQRYEENHILPVSESGEIIVLGQPKSDEVWMYNVLQHVEDPQLICNNALDKGKIVRVFEWIENGLSDGHIQNLHESELNKWFGGKGCVEKLDDRGCVGLSYYGIFKGHT